MPSFTFTVAVLLLKSTVAFSTPETLLSALSTRGAQPEVQVIPSTENFIVFMSASPATAGELWHPAMNPTGSRSAISSIQRIGSPFWKHGRSVRRPSSSFRLLPPA